MRLRIGNLRGQSVVQRFVAITEEFLRVFGLLGGLALRRLQQGVLPCQSRLELVGVVGIGQGLQQRAVIFQQRGLQARIGGGNIGADTAVSEQRHGNAHAEQVRPAFQRFIATQFDAAALPQKVDAETRQQIGFGAGHLCRTRLNLGGTRTQVGAAFNHALRRFTLRCGRRMCQYVGRAVGQTECLRRLPN